MGYKVKILFNIQRSWLKRLIFYITSSMTLEKLRYAIYFVPFHQKNA